MSTMRGGAHSRYAGLLPIEPSDEFVRRIDLKPEDVPFPNRQPPRRRRASGTYARFLIAFCTGAAVGLLWQSYGDAARGMIANSYPQFGWLAPQPALIARSGHSPDIIALAAPAAPASATEKLNATSLDAMRQSVDRIAADHEQIMHGIDQIATRITTAHHEQMARNTEETAASQKQATDSIDQIVTSITAGQEESRSTDETAADQKQSGSTDETSADQKQIPGSIDQSAVRTARALSAKASGITVGSRADEGSPQPTARSDTRPTEARPPQTLSERGKLLSAPSAHDPSCFPSASAVQQNHPGAWPTSTWRAPGHEGTLCWYAAVRPRGSDYRARGSDHPPPPGYGALRYAYRPPPDYDPLMRYRRPPLFYMPPPHAYWAPPPGYGPPSGYGPP